MVLGSPSGGPPASPARTATVCIVVVLAAGQACGAVEGKGDLMMQSASAELKVGGGEREESGRCTATPNPHDEIVAPCFAARARSPGVIRRINLPLSRVRPIPTAQSLTFGQGVQRERRTW